MFQQCILVCLKPKYSKFNTLYRVMINSEVLHGAIKAYIDGLVQEIHNSIGNGSYIFLALIHRYDDIPIASADEYRTVPIQPGSRFLLKHVQIRHFIDHLLGMRWVPKWFHCSISINIRIFSSFYHFQDLSQTCFISNIIVPWDGIYHNFPEKHSIRQGTSTHTTMPS